MSNIKLNMKKGITPFIHIIFCIAILVIPLVVMSRNGMGSNIYYIGYLTRTGVLILLFYINYFILIDRLLFKKQFILYIIVNLLLIAGTSFLQNILFEFISKSYPPPPEFLKRSQRGPGGPPHELRLLSDYVLIILAIGMSVALKVTVRWYKDSVNLEAVKASQLEADLKNLRSQLNPHFLFNTLNNIYSLIAIDTNKAQESVHRLSNLLRYILYDNDQKFVPIDKELEFTQNYIDLMRLRLAHNVKLNVQIKNEGYNPPIASLLFMTLIENAFKHGINNGSDSFVDIKILVNEDNKVSCIVENSLSDTKDKIETKNSGIGLTNLQKRLDLLYPNNHRLVIDKKEDRFSVNLFIELNADKKIMI